MDSLGSFVFPYSKSDAKQVSYDITYMWNLKKKKGYKWTYLQNKLSHRCRKQAYCYQGNRAGEGYLGDWDWHVYTTIHKVDD